MASSTHSERRAGKADMSKDHTKPNRSLMGKVADASGDLLRMFRDALGYEENQAVLPEPQGPYRVGCADLMISDMQMAPCGDLQWLNERKGVFVRVFYPCNQDAVSPTGSSHFNVIPSDDYYYSYGDVMNINRKFYNVAFSKLIDRNIQCPCLWHGPLADQSSSAPEADGGFPLVIFSHGLSANRYLQSGACGNLASDGYVVVVLEHRDRSTMYTYDISDEDQSVTHVHYWGYIERILSQPQNRKRALECEAALRLVRLITEGSFPAGLPEGEQSVTVGKEFDWNQFKGRINMDRASLVGHSYGGPTALTCSLLTPGAFKCIVMLDGWLEPTLNSEIAQINIPILFLNSYTWQKKDNVDKMMRIIGNGQSHNPNMIIMTIKGAIHFSFCDLAYWFNGTLGKLVRFCPGDLDRFQCGRIINDVTIAFMEQHTGGNGSKSLREVQQLYSENVLWGTNVDMTGHHQQTIDFAHLAARFGL